MTHRIFLIIVLFAIYACKSAAQVVVGGMVTDGDGPMKGVIIKAIADNKMLAYTVTNSAGKYTVRIPPSDKPLCLSAEHLGYEKETRDIAYKTQICNFVLHETSQVLQEVVVKASPISQRGDTLSYHVAWVRHRRFCKKWLSRHHPYHSVVIHYRIMWHRSPQHRITLLMTF